MLRIGTHCEIKPAYDMDTGARTNFDDVTGFEVWVALLRTGGDVDVVTRDGREFTINAGRLRVL